MPIAIITGASRGLGEALADGLAGEGWSLVIDARTEVDLRAAERRIRAKLSSSAASNPAANAAAHPASNAAPHPASNPGVNRPAGQQLRAIPGDVTDAEHRHRLVAAARDMGGLDLIVNNAGTLGPSPLPELTAFPLDGLREAFEANVLAPLALIQEAGELLGKSGSPRVLNVTSDASVEGYPGWGGYGASKAALDQISNVLSAERPGWKVWAVDPGDMRTRMHQDAFPGEDISDRPEPASVVPAILGLIASDQPSGRVKLSELAGLAEVTP